MHARKFNSGYTLALGGLALLASIAIGSISANSWQRFKVGAPSGANSSVDLPISFEPNHGQGEDSAKFVARGPGYTMNLNEGGVSIRFSRLIGVSADSKHPVVALKLGGRRKANPKIFGQDEMPSKSSYFTGSDPKKWLTGIPNFSQVKLGDAYDGVDVTYYGRQGELVCEFKVSPKAKPASLALEMDGVDNLHLDAQGDLVFSIAQTEMRLQKPIAYQEGSDSRHDVAVHYILSKNQVSFGLGRYDAGKVLFIHPVLKYSGHPGIWDADTNRQKSSEPTSSPELNARILSSTVPRVAPQLSKMGWVFLIEQAAAVTVPKRYIHHQQRNKTSLSRTHICEFHLESETHDTHS